MAATIFWMGGPISFCLAQEGPVTVGWVEGRAERRDGAGSSKAALAAGDEISLGDTVSVPVSGNAGLTLAGDDVLYLEEKSDLKIMSLSPFKAGLGTGTLYVRSRAIGRSIEVRTPGGTIVARGGECLIVAMPRQPVSVFGSSDGGVIVSGLAPNGGAAGAPVTLSLGGKIRLERGGPPSPTEPMTEADLSMREKVVADIEARLAQARPAAAAESGDR